MKHRLQLPLVIAVTLLLFDQLTKFAILQSIGMHASHPVIPSFFDLTHVYNTGAAFGIMQNNNLFFIFLSIFAIIVISILLIRGSFDTPLLRIAAGLLLGGVSGNLADRLLHGHVVDFLSFHLGSYTWPAFNLADSGICIAAGLLILQSFRPERPKSVIKSS